MRDLARAKKLDTDAAQGKVGVKVGKHRTEESQPQLEAAAAPGEAGPQPWGAVELSIFNKGKGKGKGKKGKGKCKGKWGFPIRCPSRGLPSPAPSCGRYRSPEWLLHLWWPTLVPRLPKAHQQDTGGRSSEGNPPVYIADTGQRYPYMEVV